MKKLLTILAASAGLAALADPVAPLSATSFEGYNGVFSVAKGDDGTAADDQADRTWGGSDVEGDANVITAYGESAKPANRPDYYASAETQNNFLKIDSAAGIERYVTTGGVAQVLSSSNVYFDMDVQFTVSDTVQEPTPNAGDKLLVWLYAPEAEGEEAVATNLIVTAATIANNLNTTPVNYVVAVPETSVLADTWYRLTVVSTTKNVSGAAVPHFQVYIDGKQATPTGTMDDSGEITALLGHDGLFGSLVKYADNDEATKTLTSVTFKGTGAVDDLVVTTEKPVFIPAGPVETMYFQVGEAQYATFTEAIAAVTANGTEITVLANVTETIVVNTGYDIVLNLNNKNITSDDEEKSCAISIDASSTGKLTITGAGYVVCTADDGEAITNDGEGSVVINGGYFSPVFKSASGYTTTVAGKKIGTAVIDNVTYSCLVDDEPQADIVIDDPTTPLSIDANGQLVYGTTTVAVAGGQKIKIGTYDVTAGFTVANSVATLNAPVITNSAPTASDALVVTDSAVTVTVNVTKGLYYGLGKGITVKGIKRPVLTQYTDDEATKSFTAEKAAGASQEFFKVFVDVEAGTAEE